MKTVIKNSKQTLLGYHDKHENNYTVIEGDLPILNNENYAPFLLTPGQHFSISTRDIMILINNFKSLESYNSLKNLVAQILILPGLLVSLIYIANIAGVFPSDSIIAIIASSNWINILFWLSMLGVITLWHDYYRTKSHPVSLPLPDEFDSKTLMEIHNSGIKFSKYELLKSIHYLNEESQSLIAEFSSSGGLDTYKLLEVLIEDPEIQEVLARADLHLTTADFKDLQISSETLPTYTYSSVRTFIIYALEDALITRSRTIKPVHFLLMLFRTFPVLQRVLEKNGNSAEILRSVVRYNEEKVYKKESGDRFNIHYPYIANGGIGQGWLHGYTFILNKFSTDINRQMMMKQGRFGIGHDDEITEMISILGRLNKNNALLIGEPGVGKSSIIKGLAQRINTGQISKQLANYKILQLDINSLIAYASSSSRNIEGLMEKAISEISNSNDVILFIDEVQDLIPASAQESGQNIASILLPHLINGNFPVIATVNYSDYKKYIHKSGSLKNSFENVEVKELTAGAALEILESQIDQLERNYGIFITFPALIASIELAQRYITDRKLPDSAVGVLETTLSWANSQGIKSITASEVAESVSLQTDIPVQNVTAQEASKLLNLEENMRARVIGQDKAVHAVVEAIKRTRADVRDPDKPIGAFLFMGPTGTGKTHLAKVLQDEFFQTNEDIHRIDMSEYQEQSSLERILGMSGGQSNVTLLDKVKSRPFSVVLFDEIEKAHKNVLDIFLQLLDEGRLTSTDGEAVNFTNTVIICTSNIGSDRLLESLNTPDMTWQDAKQAALEALHEQMRPELINRFDEIVMFGPHDIQNLTKISQLLLNELADRLGQRGIAIDWDASIPMLIADRGNEPGMGARPIKRLIQRNIESKIADEILAGGIETGDTIHIKESWITDL